MTGRDNPGPLFALALAAISLIVPLAVHLFMPVIPAVQGALGLSNAVAQLTFSIALFSMAFATLVYGSLSDRYGRRPVLLSGLALFLIGSALSAFASSVSLLILGRVVQAVGAGSSITLVRAIAQDVYGAGMLIKAIAYLTMAYALGPLLSPMLGGVLIDMLGWRSVFGFAFVLGALITAFVYLAVPESHPPSRSVRSDGRVLRNYVSLFGNVRFTGFVLQTGFATATFMVAATAASSLMKETLHHSSTEFGIYFVLFPLGLLSGNFVASRIGIRLANETMVLAGSLVWRLHPKFLWRGVRPALRPARRRHGGTSDRDDRAQRTPRRCRRHHSICNGGKRCSGTFSPNLARRSIRLRFRSQDDDKKMMEFEEGGAREWKACPRNPAYCVRLSTAFCLASY
jgi:MFS transporter, DHA1 family, multidrug resistance protein